MQTFIDTLTVTASLSHGPHSLAPPEPFGLAPEYGVCVLSLFGFQHLAEDADQTPDMFENDRVAIAGCSGRVWRHVARLVEEPGASLGLVDEHFQQARGSDIAVLVDHSMRFP